MKREVKDGSAISKAKNVGIAKDDSNNYSIEGAIDGLLEVDGIGDLWSPKKQKKHAQLTTKDEVAAMPTEEALSKVRK